MNSDTALIIGLLIGIGLGIPVGIMVSKTFLSKSSSVIISRNTAGQIESITQT